MDMFPNTTGFRRYRIPAYQVIPVYSYGIKPEMWVAINFYKVQRDCFIEVYYRDRIEHFFKGQNGLTMTRIVPHQFGEVPIIEYRNNEEGMGDIESITSLIDAHDEIIANGLDEDGKFADAILKLKNMELDDETVDKLIRLRVLTMDDDGEADYLVKPDRYEGVQSNFFCKKIQNFATKIQLFCKIYHAFQCFSVQYRAQF